jgi:hypothetical protein
VTDGVIEKVGLGLARRPSHKGPLRNGPIGSGDAISAQLERNWMLRLTPVQSGGGTFPKPHITGRSLWRIERRPEKPETTGAQSLSEYGLNAAAETQVPASSESN